ncbi:hypothetical protein Pelo_19684 [Pelomyxa schiedti]|nr:hypothetical protein Pelo_19684 [Pelomyxa schiedti]
MFCFSCYGCGSDDGGCFFGAELALKLKRLSKDKPAFDFLFHYILQLLILSLALQASTFFPLILPCCCLYFGLQCTQLSFTVKDCHT